MKLSRQQLEHLPRESLHEARNWSKADVSVAQWPPNSGQRVVIKDLRKRPFWYRAFLGRYFLWREWQALCALSDLECVPNPVARPDADCFVIAHRDGQQLETIPAEAMPEGASTQIESLVAQIHARGVTHGDLHGFNILVDNEGKVALIDWATACVFGTHPKGFKKWAYEEWRALDERALAKIKIVYAPAAMTARERDLIEHGGSRLYRLIKQLRTKLERLRGMDPKRLAARQAKQEFYRTQLECTAPVLVNDHADAESTPPLAGQASHATEKADVREVVL